MKLTATILGDFFASYLVEIVCKFFFSNNKPKDIAKRREKKEKKEKKQEE